MTLINWFLVFGGLTVTAIVIDGIRRMFASHAALKIDIDESLCDLPLSDYGSELPNGGARLVDTNDTLGNLDSIEALSANDLDSELNFELAAIEASAVDVDSLPITLDDTDQGDTVIEAIEAVADMAIADEVEVVAVAEETTAEDALVAPVPDPFSLSNVKVSLSAEEINALTSAPETEQTITSEVTQPSFEFDPTRPVHEHVESHAMVQNDLFTDQDLTKSPTAKSGLAHALIETQPSSDDILFNDTGIESFDDDLALSGAEYLAQHSQDETLTTKLAKVTSMSFGKKLLNLKRAALQEASESAAAQQQIQSLPAVEQVISILVTANDSQGLYGAQLRKLVEACGLVHGEMGIFHRFEDGLRLGKTQFSMANMMEPGTFDLNQMDHFHTPGVVFFLGLPTAQDSMKAFDFMLETAQCLATNLGGEVRDDQHSVMRPQTIEHCRQQIRDFERRNMTRRAQL
ncbi:MAG: cell division protein ZipA [Oceanospirillaceae bacterium]|jgi:cell division protein ZipA|nr:cell division protein ZipA [Oceanospirillaceae bacterium]MBT4442884.1 cell division protein ZipA [Oceanospirillaceae bacterium]